MYLENIVSENVIPEGCLNTVEEASYVCYAIEDDFRSLMEEAGADEVDSDEMEDEVCKESVLLEGEMTDRVVDFFKSVWAKLKKLFENMIEWIKEHVAQLRKKFNEHKIDKILARLDKRDLDTLGKDEELGKFHIGGPVITNTEWMSKCCDSVTEIDKIKGKDLDKDALNKAISEIPLKVAQSLTAKASVAGNGFYSVSMMKEDMKDAFLGQEKPIKGSEFKSYKKQFIDAADNDSMLRTVKSAYAKSKKAIDNMIKEVKKISAKPLTEKAGAKAFVIRVYKTQAQILAAGNAVQIDCIKQRAREAFHVIARAISKSERKSKNEATDIFAW